MADTITIREDTAQLTNSQGQNHSLPVKQFVQGVAGSTVLGLDQSPLPDNVKWYVRCGSLTVCIVQLTPELRWIKWLDDKSPARYGPEAVWVKRQLATPYVIFKVPFRNNTVMPRVEVFYRNEPLRSLDGEGGSLCWPNLLNVSPHSYGVTAWFCTQYLRLPPGQRDITSGLDAVIHHVFGGSFNASSEHHEGMSTFSLCQREKVDKRVTNVKRWEKESRKDPKFVLKVKWKPAGLTVRNLIERELEFNKLQTVPANVGALGNIMLRQLKANSAKAIK